MKFEGSPQSEQLTPEENKEEKISNILSPLNEETPEEYLLRVKYYTRKEYFDRHPEGMPAIMKKTDSYHERKAAPLIFENKELREKFAEAINNVLQNQEQRQSKEKDQEVLETLNILVERAAKEFPKTENEFEKQTFFRNTKQTRDFFPYKEGDEYQPSYESFIRSTSDAYPYSEMMFGLSEFFIETAEGREYLHSLLDNKTIFLFGGGDSIKDLLASEEYKPKKIINFDPYLKQESIGKSKNVDYESIGISASDEKIADSIAEGRLSKADEIWATYSVPYYLDKSEDIISLIQNISLILNEGGNARISPIALQETELEGETYEGRKETLIQSIKSLMDSEQFNVSIFGKTLKIHKLKKNMNEEKSQPMSKDELKAAEKEIYMTGRAMRVDETPEEYKAERERSWAEKQKAENLEKAEVEEQIESSLDAVSDLGMVKVYDKHGKFIFSGDPDQLMIFWKNKDYGTIEDIGGISDEEGKSIFRFGPTDGRGFTDRKRIGGLFQQLESKVASKKRAAEDAQKLGELRAKFGIKQEMPVTPQITEQSIEMTPIQQEQAEGKVENELKRENLFDEKKAKQIVDVVKDWVKYGGKLYDHMTGKNPKFEKGVDYKVNPDGSVDMESFRKARRKKAEEWFNEPGNKKWFEDFQKFHQEHSAKDLSFEAKTVMVKQPNGPFVEKQRWTTPYSYQDGWLYYESNYFDEQKSELRQPEREKTQYRVYFNVDGGDIMSTFCEMIDELNQNFELQKLGFQIKTAEARLVSKTEEGKKAEMEKMAMDYMNQKDRIVMYLGDKGIERALPILKKYAERNRQKFDKEGILLAQELTDNNGEKIPGISITSETKGKSPDPAQFAGEYKSFNDMQVKVVESSFWSLITALKNPKTLEGMSAKYPTMKENLAKLPPNASQEDYLRGILADPNGESFLTKNLQAIYPQWAKAFGMKEKNIAFKEK